MAYPCKFGGECTGCGCCRGDNGRGRRGRCPRTSAQGTLSLVNPILPMAMPWAGKRKRIGLSAVNASCHPINFPLNWDSQGMKSLEQGCKGQRPLPPASPPPNVRWCVP